jgi:hypothetical protein
VYVALGLVGLPVVTLLSPIGGYLFGSGGMLLSAAARWLRECSPTGGAAVAGSLAGKKYSVKERWFRRELNRRGGLLLMMRLLLVVPFVWINALAGWLA